MNNMDLGHLINESYKYFKGKNTNKSLSGDVCELSIRKLLSKHLENKYKTGYGMIYKDDAHKSGQIDVIIYKKNAEPLFVVEDDLVVMKPEDVVATIESKIYMPSTKSAEVLNVVNKLQAVKMLNNKIRTYLFVSCFQSNNHLNMMRELVSSNHLDGVFGWWGSLNSGEKLQGENGFDGFIGEMNSLLDIDI